MYITIETSGRRPKHYVARKVAGEHRFHTIAECSSADTARLIAEAMNAAHATFEVTQPAKVAPVITNKRSRAA